MKKLTLLLILFVCAGSGCQTESGSANAGNGNRTGSADPKADVIQASRKLVALNALSGMIEGTGTTPFKQRVEYAAPDRYRVTYRDDSGAEMEMIVAGGKSYIKSGNNWSEMPGDIDSTPTLRTAFTDESLSTLSDVKLEGEEAVNGKQAQVYSYKLTTKIGNLPVTQKTWVDKESGLPVKTTVDSPDGPVKNLLVTFDTKSPVTIELPKANKQPASSPVR